MDDFTQQQQCNTLFSSSHEAFTKIDHILDRKTHPNILKGIKIIQCLHLDSNEIQLEIKQEELGNPKILGD